MFWFLVWNNCCRETSFVKPNHSKDLCRMGNKERYITCVFFLWVLSWFFLDTWIYKSSLWARSLMQWFAHRSCWVNGPLGECFRSLFLVFLLQHGGRGIQSLMNWCFTLCYYWQVSGSLHCPGLPWYSFIQGESFGAQTCSQIWFRSLLWCFLAEWPQNIINIYLLYVVLGKSKWDVMCRAFSKVPSTKQTHDINHNF